MTGESAPGDFWCEAYGPPPDRDESMWSDDADWPRCFFSADPAVSRCASAEACSDAMASERHRVFARIHERAADGDPVMRFLADEFPTPGTLLGSRNTDGPQTDGGAR